MIWTLIKTISLKEIMDFLPLQICSVPGKAKIMIVYGLNINGSRNKFSEVSDILIKLKLTYF